MILELKKAIEEWGVDTSDFSEDTQLSEFIHDDLDLSLFVGVVEDEFGIVVTDIVAESWKTLADVQEFLDQL